MQDDALLAPASPPGARRLISRSISTTLDLYRPRPARHGRSSDMVGLQPAVRHAGSEVVRLTIPSSAATALARVVLVQAARLQGCAVEALC